LIAFKLRFVRLLIAEWAESLRRRWVLYKTSAEYGMTFERGVEVLHISRFVSGPGTIVGSGALLHCGGFAWSDGGGGIAIGAESYVGPRSVLFGAGEIRIGNKVAIGPGCVITSHGHQFDESGVAILDQPTTFARVTIEDDVYVGSGSIVLPGVRIGRGAVIGAGAVVSREVPAGAVAIGVPARIVRFRDGYPEESTPS
jgi:acetyltransferase-like isoleucine patch superfamily enzyme